MSEKLANDLFDEFYEWRLVRSPEFSTLAGSKSYNSNLEIFTEQRFSEDLSSCEDMKSRADKLVHQVTDSHIKLNLKFLIAELDTFITGYPFKGFYFPINYLEGVQVDFQRLAEWTSFDSNKDYTDLIERYKSFNGYADQVIDMMRTAISHGQTNHQVSMKGVVNHFNDLASADARSSPFFEPFKNIKNVDQSQIETLQVEAEKAITSCVQPAFQKISTFLSSQYMPATRPNIAASSLPGNGVEFYKCCLAFHTSTDMTPQQIHQTGLNEVERIEREMKEIVKEMGHDLSLPDFTNMIRNDKKNFFTSRDELLQSMKDIITYKIEPKILDIFDNKPASKLEVLETPASTPDAPAAFYIGGTPDGSRPGRLYVNTNKFHSQPRYEMISLALHESIPGHHLQGSYMCEVAGIPMFRKVMEDRIYSQSPSRFPINTAYTEGWGLYSESLGFDMNLYDDPLDRFGHLSAEMFRASRLVVDTGMHALGWTSEEAVQYMIKHTAASEENVRAEVDRYITWPGQATGYKIGQLKIKEMRRKAETELGEKFNLKKFHEVVLDSAGPLNILEEQVDLYIQANK